MNILNQLTDVLPDSPSALVFNACSALGFTISASEAALRCLTPEFPAFCGEAVTIKLDCSAEEGDDSSFLYYEMLELIAKSSRPMAAVIESVSQPLSHAAAGDGMAKAMLTAGTAALVSNGAVRDLAGIRQAGLMTFAGGLVPGHRHLRWSGLGDPVFIGGMHIHTGDLLHGDEDGLIVIPPQCFSRIIPACRLVRDFETAAHAELRRTDRTAAEKQASVQKLSEQLDASVKALT